MASFEKRASGWRAQVQKLGVRRSMVFPTKAEAQDWAARIEAEIRAGSLGQYPIKTLAEAVERYRREITDKKPKGVARADQLRFDAWLRDFPALASKLLSEITAADLAAWRDARLKQVSESSVLREAQQFRPIWTLAIDEWQWAGKSPWKGVRLPQKGHARDRGTRWQEVKRLVRSVGYRQDAAPVSPQQEVMWVYMIALHTAMRSGEILKMTRASVDLSRRVYRLDQHKTQQAVGVRHVPLPRRVAKLLQVLDARAAQEGREHYFTISDQSRDVLWRKVRDRLRIEGLNFHDSRAAALTWLAKRVDVMTLAKISGHVDINQLFSAYYREAPADIAARL